MKGLSWKRLLRAASAGPLLQVRKLRMRPRGAAASEQLPGCLSPHAGASSHLWAAALDLCPEVTTALAHVPQASGQRRPPPRLSCLPLSPFTLFYVLLPGCACKCSHVHCGSSICLTRQGPVVLLSSRTCVRHGQSPWMKEQSFVSPASGMSPSYLCLLWLNVKSGNAAKP